MGSWRSAMLRCSVVQAAVCVRCGHVAPHGTLPPLGQVHADVLKHDLGVVGVAEGLWVELVLL